MDASVERTQAKMFRCTLYLQSIPKPFIVHDEHFVFWHLPPSQLPFYHSQGKHLIFYIGYKTFHFLYRMFTHLFLSQSLRSAVPCHLVCPKVDVNPMDEVVVQQESLQGAFKRGKGKLVTTEAMSWCSWQGNQTLFFPELSLKAASQQQAEGKAELQVQSFLRSQKIHVTIQ